MHDETVFRQLRSGGLSQAASLRRPAIMAEEQRSLPGSPDRTVCTTDSTETLPGTVVRREGDAMSKDLAVDEAYAGLGDTYALYWHAFRRESIDGLRLPLEATVHYGMDYDNAFWNGQRMVFGDGDGELFNRFTISLSVIGHELAHGVTQYTANLTYEGQSGALNESISDVFGSLVEQHARGQRTDEATWLIGAGLFTERVQGVALRSMKAPGTAYDDPVLGADPQPADMSGYVKTEDDAGGVHVNSGIPNRAFYLTAARIGGNAWEAPGLVWYDALTSGLADRSTFANFADATTRAAIDRYGKRSSQLEAVRDAWRAVGVTA